MNWQCPYCSNGSISVDDVGFKADFDDCERKSLLEAISILQDEVKTLVKENSLLNDQLRLYAETEASGVGIGLRQNRRWESVPARKSSPNELPSHSDFPPLKNRFSVLTNDEEDSPTVTSLVYRPSVVPKSTQFSLKTPRRKCSQPIPSRPRIKSKVFLFSDSQGRTVTEKITQKSNAKVCGTIKPGASFDSVTSELEDLQTAEGPVKEGSHSSFETDAVVVIMAGTNDVARNESSGLLRSLKKRLKALSGQKVIVCGVPFRYDLPSWSCVNSEVSVTNEKMLKICSFFSNCVFLDLSTLGRRFHTAHGLHLNSLGKEYVAGKIVELVCRLESVGSSCLSSDPIELIDLSVSQGNL